MIFRTDALAGKRILVTGGSSGIGLDTALLLAEAGASVIVSGRDQARLDQAMAKLGAGGHQAAVGDVGSLATMHDMIVSVAKDGGPLDGVFHAAGVAAVRLARMINERHVDDVFGAAVNGALGIAKAAGKRDVFRDGASIVLMSSVAGARGKMGMVTYSSAKVALGGLTRSLAAELAPREMRVNEIVSGAVETPMHASIVQNLDDQAIEAYRSTHLLGFGKAEDVSNMATFLLSDAARWITGATIAVDGGCLAA